MLPLWYSVLGWFVSIVTIAGNGFVIYMIIGRPRLRTKTNGFVLSLAAADLCVGASYFLTDHICHKLNCKDYIPYAVGSFLSAASATNLCLLIIDRYITIMKPLEYSTLMTRTRVVLLISAVWLSSFVAHLVFILTRSMLATSDDYIMRVFLVFDFVVFEILPLFVSSFATGHICVIAKRNSRQITSLVAQLRFNLRREDNRGRFANSRERTSAKLVGVAGSVFFICYLYEIFYTIYCQLLGSKDSTIRYIAWLLNIVNSAANPIAYAFFKGDINMNLKRMLRFKNRPELAHRDFPLAITAAHSNTELS